MTGCRHGYKVEGDKVYYEYWNEGSGQNKRLLDQADANSFEPISFNCIVVSSLDETKTTYLSMDL